MATRIELRGLNQCLTNMRTLLADVQTKIARDSLREALWHVARPMRQATYTTFIRRTGAIRRGLSVAVQRDFKDDRLKGYVTEYEQSFVGAATPTKVALRRRFSGTRKSAPIQAKAFWWIFLERGTRDRRAVRMPNFLRKGRLARNRKQWKAQARFGRSGSRGRVEPRPWLAPVAARTSADAMQTFRFVLLDAIEKRINSYPKK